MDSETSDDQSNSIHLSGNEDCESENGSPQLVWDESFNEVILVDSSDDQGNLNNMWREIMNDASAMTEERECDLQQVYPTAKFEYKRVNHVSAGDIANEASAETRVCEASMSQQMINLYSLNVNNLHNIENVMRDMYELSRMNLYIDNATAFSSSSLHN